MESIDDVLDRIRVEMSLESQREHELLEEIRVHLEEAVVDGLARGLDDGEALTEAAARFGVEEVGRPLQATHEGWGVWEGIAAAALPVLFALLLRWVVFDPAGSFAGWRPVVSRPAFWVIAAAALLIPVLRIPRRRHALVSWTVFWGLSVIMIVGGAAQR